MAFSHFVAILLVLLPIAALADTNGVPPILAPFFDNICNDVQCGRGSCEASPGSPLGFVCNCEDGWNRTRYADEENLEFLPCIIPECSLDYSCMPAPPPAPTRNTVPHNLSFFEPCNWVYCGDGTCTRNTTHTHTCQCNPGATNLLNISAFPCYPDCAIGSDCGRLGIRTANATSNPRRNPSSGDSNLAMPLSLGKFNLMVVFLVSAATVFLK